MIQYRPRFLRAIIGFDTLKPSSYLKWPARRFKLKSSGAVYEIPPWMGAAATANRLNCSFFPKTTPSKQLCSFGKEVFLIDDCYNDTDTQIVLLMLVAD